MNRLPAWFKQEIPPEKTFKTIRLFSEFGLHSVCQEALCPNIGHCFKADKMTFMILGSICTRGCAFCGVNKRTHNSSLGVDEEEPYRLSRMVAALNLHYVVITSVTRDDLSDGGARYFAKAIELIRAVDRKIKVEVLIPDLQGKASSIGCIAGAGPDVVAHNIETVSRLYADLRPKADYRLSLNVLSRIKELNPGVKTKSSLMLGMGEIKGEVIAAMRDLVRHRCEILTLGQYLAPSPRHYPVREFISPGQFKEYEEIGISLGFKKVLSGPKVRSSYQAEKVYAELECV